MSRRNVAASITHTPRATATLLTSTAPESPQLRAFLRSTMEKFGLTDQEVRKRATEMFGSLEYAMQATEASEAADKAAIERAFPNGYANAIQVGVSDGGILELEDIMLLPILPA